MTYSKSNQIRKRINYTEASLLALLLFTPSILLAQETFDVKSPNGAINLRVDVGAKLVWSVQDNGQELIGPSAICLRLNGLAGSSGDNIAIFTSWLLTEVSVDTKHQRREDFMIQKKEEKESRTDSSQEFAPIELPKPKFDRGTSVPKALQERRTTRDISDKKLPLQVLSNLLWAACGVNRKKGPFEIPGRTAASASNSQEIDVYVAMEKGVYLYDAFRHRLDPVFEGDLRPLAISHGQSSLAVKPPVQLIYVADVDKLVNSSGYQEPGLHDPEIQKAYYYVDTGLIAGNVYLFAASQGLAAWFHNCNRPALKARLNLRDEQRVLFGQTIGYRKKK